ncbi:MAG: sigma-70 family RNA polymerase sigma factor [Symploca sp. SIO1B1]|nr:sigma-70 family RNA polymerase sigma factor [Symploca sp. SIO1B1]
MSEKRVVIRRGIDNLPPRLRETFILHFYQDLAYQEIAQRQEISYQNVCKRISQARKILREELRGYFVGEETDSEIAVEVDEETPGQGDTERMDELPVNETQYNTLTEEMSTAATVEYPESVVEKEESSPEIRKAIAELPEKFWERFIGHFDRELTYSQTVT